MASFTKVETVEVRQGGVRGKAEKSGLDTVSLRTLEVTVDPAGGAESLHSGSGRGT
jgi:hypothetical protein